MKKADLTLVYIVTLALGPLMLYLGMMNAELREENQALREQVEFQRTTPSVHVTCECPDYEEGYDDCQWVNGCEQWDLSFENLKTICDDVQDCGKPRIACNPSEMSPEDLKFICGEFETYGYVPDC